MVAYMECKFDDILTWCKENNQTEWLKKTVADFEAANERKITYIELKNAFYNEFFKDLAPKKKEKKPSMFDIIASL